MKVLTLTSGLAGLAMVVGGILYATGPGFRTTVNQQMHDWIGWTETARQADPVGFSNHVQQRLSRDLDTMQASRGELKQQVGELADEVRKLQALAEYAENLAVEFRGAYQTAEADGGFPVTVRNAAYTGEQIEGQVSLLLAEAEGYRNSLQRLEQVRQQADEKLEALAVRINNTQAQLAILPTQRELLRARVLSDEGEQLVAQVDRLLEDNNQVIQGNPVRTVVELISAPTPDDQPPSRIQQAREYLTAKPAVNKQGDDTVEKVSMVKPRRGKKGGKPIFDQK